MTVYSALGVTPIIYGSMALLQIDFFYIILPGAAKSYSQKKLISVFSATAYNNIFSENLHLYVFFVDILIYPAAFW